MINCFDDSWPFSHNTDTHSHMDLPVQSALWKHVEMYIHIYLYQAHINSEKTAHFLQDIFISVLQMELCVQLLSLNNYTHVI